ncbi:hypothetical protein GZL_07293 [Streptomyces sp. 769]|nr:hypothetical protein GZL_07293 [Streptomyces sp. 769]
MKRGTGPYGRFPCRTGGPLHAFLPVESVPEKSLTSASC